MEPHNTYHNTGFHRLLQVQSHCLHIHAPQIHDPETILSKECEID